MAIRLNDPSYSEWANIEAEKIKEAFNAQFLVPIESTSYKWYGSQTATVLAFKYGMVPGEIRNNVAEGLKYDIEETHNGHHTSGIFGLRHIHGTE